MDVVFSPMETGACPLCKKFKTCQFLILMDEALEDNRGDIMEIVVYRCPHFVEN